MPILLETGFRNIANGSALSRSFSAAYPQLRVTKCEHHYIFHLRNEAHTLYIIAVFHEKMDLMQRLKDRLA